MADDVHIRKEGLEGTGIVPRHAYESYWGPEKGWVEFDPQDPEKQFEPIPFTGEVEGTAQVPAAKDSGTEEAKDGDKPTSAQAAPAAKEK